MKIIPFPRESSRESGTIKKPYKTVRKREKEVAGAEGYKLTVSSDGVLIEAETERGLFYGGQTLTQLEKEYKDELPVMSIKDFPKYAHRGYMLDCSRHFFPISVIKKQIDIMALLKLNIFHWHLTDDQGWRIQIDKYPRLEEVGSKRTQTAGDGKRVDGCYTKDEIREVVAYCAERFIDVIPEIDMPGHFRAALASYPELSCDGKTVSVGEGFGISPNILCAGKDAAYEFCRGVLDEVAELFPYKYVHLGGDEAIKLYWLDCSDCQRKMAENGLKNEEELQGYFMSQMTSYLNAKGKSVINWNDGMLGNNIAGDIAVQYWKESKECKAVIRQETAKGRKVIISPFFSFYLDYPHGMTPLKKTYNYRIDDDIAAAVIGLEAPLWTEHVADEDRIWTMTYPRLAAVAELAWTGGGDYEGFLSRLENFYELLTERRIGFCRDADPSFIKGKASVAKFFFNALFKVDKGNLKAMKATKKKIKKKYNR